MKTVKHSPPGDNYWSLHADSGEFKVGGRPVPFPFCLGTINPNGKINVWTPAGGLGLPRGYKKAAQAALQAEADRLLP
jgi:hypothetical protein